MALAAVLMVAGPAWAQERPVTTPTRDVDVLYQAVAEGRAVEQRSRFAVAAGKIRIDTPSRGLYVIVDRGARQMDLVSDGDRRVLELPYDASRSVTGIAAGGAFQRVGSGVVAGVGCTDWRTEEASGHALTLCMTGDGVLLRVRAGGTVLVQAVRVVYGGIDPAVFAIPGGYQRTVGRGATP
jgi:hypothetical protein